MKTIRILESFDGFPNGKDEKRFTKGDEPEVSNEYAKLLIDKGLAKEIDVKAPEPASPAPTKKDAAA